VIISLPSFYIFMLEITGPGQSCCFEVWRKYDTVSNTGEEWFITGAVITHGYNSKTNNCT
jgi:hypothetical protein